MASQEKAKSRGSATREQTKKQNGYWSRQRQRTTKNIRKRLEKHIALNPNDKIAKIAYKKRILG